MVADAVVVVFVVLVVDVVETWLSVLWLSEWQLNVRIGWCKLLVTGSSQSLPKGLQMLDLS